MKAKLLALTRWILTCGRRRDLMRVHFGQQQVQAHGVPSCLFLLPSFIPLLPAFEQSHHGSNLDKETLLLYSNRTRIELYSVEVSIFALAKYFLNGGFHT